MTPKEKAKELFDKYYIICQEFTQEIQCSVQAKQCALIAVDEIINSTKNKNQIMHFMPCNSSDCGCIQYWLQVKREIQEL